MIFFDECYKWSCESLQVSDFIDLTLAAQQSDEIFHRADLNEGCVRDKGRGMHEPRIKNKDKR
jgi:hypothetical protein